MEKPYSTRELILLAIIAAIVVAIVTRVPEWWMASLVIFVAAVTFGVVIKRPVTLQNTAIAAAGALVLGLAMRAL